MGINSRDHEPTASISDTEIPTIAIFVDVEIKITGNGKKIEIIYRDNKYGREKLRTDDPELHFRELLASYASGNDSAPRKKIDRPPGRKYRSSLSLRLEELVYVAFRVSSKHDNWRFCHLDDPFTVQSGYGADATDDSNKIAFDAKRVLTDGTVVPDTYNTVEEGTVSRVAYFIVDGHKLKVHHEGKSIPFNIHLDIVSTENNIDRFIPIIIDPDVGYPDGGGTPP